jgi:hypothetical protein
MSSAIVSAKKGTSFFRGALFHSCHLAMNGSVEPALSLFDFLELLECAARLALLRGTDRLVLGADLLVLGADLLLLHADLLLLQAPALGVVSGASILVLGTLRVVLDTLDGLSHALLFAPALGQDGARQGQHEDEDPQSTDDETTMRRCHKFSFHFLSMSRKPPCLGGFPARIHPLPSAGIIGRKTQ